MMKPASPEPTRLTAETPGIATTAAGPSLDGYLPLPIQNLLAGEPAPCELFVRSRVRGQTLDQFTPFCAAKQRLERSWLIKLQKLGISRAYVRRRDLPAILHYLDRHLPVVLDGKHLEVRDQSERVTDITWFWVQQFFTHTQVQVAEQLKRGFAYVDHLLSFIRQDHHHRSWLLDLFRLDRTVYSHSLNASLLGMAFANYLGWPERQIREFGCGALLHDFGMTKVPPAILTKKSGLSPEEREQIRKHPLAGFQRLKGYKILGRQALLLILQHHENGDGSGYPEGLKLAHIHPLARAMRLVDSFDALVSPRYWRQGIPPVRALWIMQQDWQKRGIYDGGLLVEFIKFIAGYEKPRSDNRSPVRRPSLAPHRFF